jgi:hypothetical protein
MTQASAERSSVINLSSRQLLRLLQSNTIQKDCDDNNDNDENGTDTDEFTEQTPLPSSSSSRPSTKFQRNIGRPSKFVKMARESIAAIVTPDIETELRSDHEKIIWRDFSFLVVAMILASIMSYVELHSNDVEARGGTLEDVSQGGIVDVRVCVCVCVCMCLTVFSIVGSMIAHGPVDQGRRATHV